jgi:plastocyanin
MHRFIPLVAVACLLLAGCAARASATTTSSAAAQTNVVDMPASYKFEPVHISVAAGSTVTWTNHDNFTHSVLVDGTSDLRMVKPGESTQITFSTPGEYHYICTLHTQNMQGSVTVT